MSNKNEFLEKLTDANELIVDDIRNTFGQIDSVKFVKSDYDNFLEQTIDSIANGFSQIIDLMKEFIEKI